MPSGFAALDTGMPDLNKIEGTEAKLVAMEDYLVQLLEQLRYTLHNLGVENFNQTDLQNITEPIYAEIKDTKEGLETRLSVDENGISTLVSKTGINSLGENDTLYSEISQNATAITTKVSNNGVISAINQTAEQITIDASRVDLSGLVTFSNLSTSGQTTINGANITTGEINSVNIRGVNIYGAKYFDANTRAKLDLTSTSTLWKLLFGSASTMTSESNSVFAIYADPVSTNASVIYLAGNDVLRSEFDSVGSLIVDAPLRMTLSIGYGSSLPSTSSWTSAVKTANIGRVFFKI